MPENRVGRCRTCLLYTSELGLVDELGGLDKALDIAIAKAGVDAYTVMIYPKKESFFESLMNTNPGNYVKARMLKEMCIRDRPSLLT